MINVYKIYSSTFSPITRFLNQVLLTAKHTDTDGIHTDGSHGKRNITSIIIAIVIVGVIIVATCTYFFWSSASKSSGICISRTFMFSSLPAYLNKYMFF
jgi:hypothetical protein